MNLETKTITPRTPEEIDALKANWRNDPNWDIEDTEGFELHRDELVAYRMYWESHCKAQQDRRIREFAAPLGIENNPALAEYLMRQEATITELKTTIDQLQGKLPHRIECSEFRR